MIKSTTTRIQNQPVMFNIKLTKKVSKQTIKQIYLSFLTLALAFFGSTSFVQAHPNECNDLNAPVTFIESTGIVCLQNVKVSENSGTFFYKAALQWLGEMNPSQFKLVSVEDDIALESNNPSFLTDSGILEIPRVDIPRTFGTERYSASLVLKQGNDSDVFEITSSAIYIDPNYIPNQTWEPYALLDPTERRNVNLLGQSIPFAKLADAVYDFDIAIIDRWELIQLENKDSGLQAGVYRNQDTGELGLAFRGTEFCDSIFDGCSLNDIAESALDVLADSQLTLGFNGSQFRHAFEFTQEVIDQNPGQTITITGHSLGGGLAQAVGAAFGLKTFAFNSAPVPDDFLDDHPPFLSNEELNNIIHVIADIHDPVSNTDESGDFYLNASHISALIQFDFDNKEISPAPLAELDALRFNKHGMTKLIENASTLVSIYRDGW